MRAHRPLVFIAALAIVAGSDFERPFGAGRIFYAALDGSPNGDGSEGRPLNLPRALSNQGPIGPGDTLWIRGGTYRGAYVSQLKGTTNAPVIVRAFPGERVTLDRDVATTTADSATLAIVGDHTWYWGLEVTNSNTNRDVSYRPHSIYVSGDYNKLINCVVHDGGMGIADQTDGIGNETYGCLVYYSGARSSPEGVHGLYIQNRPGGPTKYVRETITFGNESYGFHVYGESGEGVSNIYMEGNVSFENSTIYDKPAKSNILIGGTVPSERIVLRSNHSYMTGTSASNVKLGYSDNVISKDLLLEHNTFVGGGVALEVKKWESVVAVGNAVSGPSGLVGLDSRRGEGHTDTWDQNTYLSPASRPFHLSGSATMTFAQWKTATGYDRQSDFSVSKPVGTNVDVRPNLYETGRAHIIVYNWVLAREVAVDLSASGIVSGDHFEVRDAMNYYGQPVVSGIYNGSRIAIPMTGLTVAAPVGSVDSVPAHTAPQFGVFILQRTGGAARPEALN